MDYSNNSDIELIRLIRDSKPVANNAFNIIYRKYSPQIYGYCLYKTNSKEEADELMQETWIKFFNSVLTGKSTDNILPLLLR